MKRLIFLLAITLLVVFVGGYIYFLGTQNFYLEDFLNDSEIVELNDWIQNGESNLVYVDDVLDFNSLTLKQKLAQMVIAFPKDEFDLNKYAQLNIGGVFIDGLDSSKKYKKMTDYFIGRTDISPFITTDMEGCWNPFENFYNSQDFTKIETEEQAYKLGLEHGKILRENGFNMDFSPVIDLEDRIWKCRSFNGDGKEVFEKASVYSNGLGEYGILSVAKHYPGKTLIENPHDKIVYGNITEEDLFPFEELVKKNISGIMLSHLIVSGKINSEGRPVSVSEEVISNLRKNFSGLIITDEINMLGLENYYCPEIRNCENKKQMYVDLFKSGNDIVLNLARDNREIFLMIFYVEKAVREGYISEEKIDESVKRILSFKRIEFVE